MVIIDHAMCQSDRLFPIALVKGGVPPGDGPEKVRQLTCRGLRQTGITATMHVTQPHYFRGGQQQGTLGSAQSYFGIGQNT
ncbi:hypothetical protein [Saccharopolyspora elongata]|uniref:hypothetical protein n=1 Tax=Saccharopolyspora elongata TaxID=2530387 RepID=UPI001404A728|nr:hypothetical protein [Saccharopolyspora elongata]